MSGTAFKSDEILGYRESIKRLSAMVDKLRKILVKESMLAFLPAWCFLLAIKGEIRTWLAINSERLNSPVVWDTETSLPSHPSLAADAKSSADYLGENDLLLKLILQSFSGWTPFCEETIQCACGGHGFKKRNVGYGIFVKHDLLKDGSSLNVRQMVAIQSEDADFLDKHFSWKAENVGLQNSVIVYSSKNRVAVGGAKGVEIANLETKSASEFYNASEPGTFEFGRRIAETINSAKI